MKQVLFSSNPTGMEQEPGQVKSNNPRPGDLWVPGLRLRRYPPPNELVPSPRSYRRSDDHRAAHADKTTAGRRRRRRASVADVPGALSTLTCTSDIWAMQSWTQSCWLRPLRRSTRYASRRTCRLHDEEAEIADTESKPRVAKWKTFLLNQEVTWISPPRGYCIECGKLPVLPTGVKLIE